MRAKRSSERGFALLLVFLMAAAVALALYAASFRMAFETERDKEQLLIDRGNQYKRAIQLYYTQFRRYPSSIDDLESTNDKRFLRRRYVDPFTGKDQWRLIHTNGMFLTDSKVQPAPAAQPTTGTGPGQPGAGPTTGGPGSPIGTTTSSTSSTGSSSTGSTSTSNNSNPAPQVNQTVLARPSDRTLPNNQSFPSNTGAGSNNLPPITYTGNAQNLSVYNPNDPNSLPPITLFPNGYNAPAQGGATQPNQLNPNPLNQGGVNPLGLNQPGANPLTLNQPGANQLPNPQPVQPQFNQQGLNQPGSVNLPGVVPDPLQQNLVQQGLNNQQSLNNGTTPGQQVNPTNVFPDPNTTQPLQPGINAFPQNNNLQQQGNLQQGNLQQNGLPNQGNFNPGAAQGMPPAGGPGQSALGIINGLLTTPRPPPAGIGPQSAAPATQTIGGGLAGVASTFAGPSIKTYGGRNDFSEWEFVFQLQQQTGVPGATGTPGSTGAPAGTPPIGTGR